MDDISHDDGLAHAEQLISQGRSGEASQLLRARMESGRGGVLTRLLLVRALIRAGNTMTAIEVARETASLNPGIPSAPTALGEALRTAGHLPAAIGEFQRALRMDPAFEEARFGLGMAWLDAGESDKALEAFAAVSAKTVPDLARYIADARATKMRQRSDARYVRHLFDQFSVEYDSRMRGQLGYQAPEILRALVELVMPERKGLAMLDLGCGTGLSGAAFRDLASRLDGVDLSPQMIERARARGIYDSLEIGDIETAFTAPERRYDLIFAADTLVYLGDLARLFGGLPERLLPGGAFVFTLEKKDGAGFEIGPKRRWRHSDAYVRSLATDAGFEVAGILECVPRTEAGLPVPGLAIALILA